MKYSKMEPEENVGFIQEDDSEADTERFMGSNNGDQNTTSLIKIPDPMIDPEEQDKENLKKMRRKLKID